MTLGAVDVSIRDVASFGGAAGEQQVPRRFASRNDKTLIMRNDSLICGLIVWVGAVEGDPHQRDHYEAENAAFGADGASGEPGRAVE